MTSLEFVNPSGNLTLDESQIISLNPVKSHTGKGDLRSTVQETRSLDDYAQRQDRLNLISDGSTIWTGYLVGVSHNERQGTSTIRADGIAKRLEETRPDYESIGGPVSYSDIALHDAIRDYWSRTEFTNYTVTDQNPTVVDTDAELQSADTVTEFSNLISPADTDPMDATGDGLELLQSGFFFEGETLTLSGDVSYSDASSGEAENMFAGTGFSDSVNFSTDYTIPASNVGFAWRVKADDDPDSDSLFEIPGWKAEVDGQTIIDRSEAETNDSDWGWDQFSGISSDLGSGSHTLTITENGADNGGIYRIDAFFIYDTRFTYNFDNTVDANNWLSGPELYPQEYSQSLTETTSQFSISEATVNLNIDDTSNNQSISLSFDSGSTFKTDNNTSSFTAEPDDPTRSVLSRLTLSRYGSRTTASPTEGYLGQSIDTYELLGDLTDLVVIDSLELTRTHFDNLQTLHDFGDFNWNITHDSSDINNLVVNSFQAGDETRTSPSEWDNPQNISSEVKAEFYFNSVYLEGAKDENGDRPTVEVKDGDAISNDGREIQVFLRDFNLTTQAGAEFRANSLLTTALSNNDLVGTIESPPNLVEPGFSYLVDFGNGEKLKTLETIQIRLSQGELTATNDFVVREDFGEDISKLQRNIRQVENEV